MIRLLIADDSRAIRDGLRAAFDGERDIEIVGEAEDGQMAVQLAQELRPDVLLLDLSMPALGGLDVMGAVTTTLPGARIVVFSIDVRLRRRALSVGAADFVSKDAPTGELLRAIRRAAGATDPQSPPTERIGEYLLARAMITEAQLDDALERQADLRERGQGRRLGEILCELGAISQIDLDRALDRETRGLV